LYREKPVLEFTHTSEVAVFDGGSCYAAVAAVLKPLVGGIEQSQLATRFM
jgi:hypothetical protein